MLGAHLVAVTGVHQGGAVLGRALQIGHAAQKLDLVLLELALPLRTPVRPMIADVLEFPGSFLRVGHSAGQLGDGAVGFAQRLDGGIDRGDDLAVELHLLAHVPVQHARQKLLPGLHQRR